MVTKTLTVSNCVSVTVFMNTVCTCVAYNVITFSKKCFVNLTENMAQLSHDVCTSWWLWIIKLKLKIIHIVDNTTGYSRLYWSCIKFSLLQSDGRNMSSFGHLQIIIKRVRVFSLKAMEIIFRPWEPQSVWANYLPLKYFHAKILVTVIWNKNLFLRCKFIFLYTTV